MATARKSHTEPRATQLHQRAAEHSPAKAILHPLPAPACLHPAAPCFPRPLAYHARLPLSATRLSRPQTALVSRAPGVVVEAARVPLAARAVVALLLLWS